MEVKQTKPRPKPGRPADEDEIEISELIRRLRNLFRHICKEQRFIWISLAVTLSIGLLIAFGSGREYKSSMRMLASVSEYASSINIFTGEELSQKSTQPVVIGDLYPEVANTLDFRIALAKIPIHFSTLKEPVTVPVFFREYYKPSPAAWVRKYTIGLPGLLLKKLRSEPQAVPAINNTNDTAVPVHQNPDQDDISNVVNRLSVNIDKNEIAIEATMPDRLAASDLTSKAAGLLIATINEKEKARKNELLRFAESQSEISKQRFEAAQEKLVVFSGQNRGNLSAIAQVEALRLQSDYNVASVLYRDDLSRLEQIRMLQNEDSFVFTELIPGTASIRQIGPNRFRTILLYGFLGVFIGLTWIALRQFSRWMKSDET